jgi:protein TonB
MFDRFVSPSPIGVRGGALAFCVHAGILALGLHTVRTARQTRVPEIVTLPPVAPMAPRSPTVDGGPAIPTPGPITEPLPPITIPVTPGLPGVVLTEPTPTLPTGSGGPVGDSLGVYTPGVVDQLPELLSAPPPQYPELLRQAHIQGVVVVQGVVDTLGRMERGNLRVLFSPHPALSTAAEASIAAAIFRPGRVWGRAVRVLVQVPVQFTISRR